MTYHLRPYQKACLNKCLANPKGGLCVLPTGSGKSIIIAALCTLLDSSKILVVTPRRELTYQNTQKIQKLHKESKHNQKVATCLTIHKAYKRKIYKDILIIDEAHLITPHCGMFKTLMHKAKVIYGFTATPFRMDYGVIDSFLGTRIYEIKREHLIRDQYLLRRTFMAIPENLYINLKFGDFQSVKKLSNSTCKRTQACVEHFIKNWNQDSLLVFVCDLNHAIKTQKCFENYNINSLNIISHKTHPKERENIIQNFKNKKIKILINCEILTTGFDYPDLRNILILRPTHSYTLYEQMCGRGDRISFGKDCNKIYDYTLNSFNFSKTKTINTHRYCLFCYKITDYRLTHCSFCKKMLIKTKIPTKKCPECKKKISNLSTFCEFCGQFVRINCYKIEFDKIIFHNPKPYLKYITFGDSKIKFPISYNEFREFYKKIRNKQSKFIKNSKNKIIMAYNFSKLIMYYQYDNKNNIKKFIKLIKKC